jgi:hypothetical protein
MSPSSVSFVVRSGAAAVVAGSLLSALPPSPALAQPAAAKGTLVASAEPATPEQAARVLDLRTFARVPGSAAPSLKSLGTLMYGAPVAPKEAFEFQKRELGKLGFKELPGGYQADDNYSGHFSHQGYKVSVSTSPPYGGQDKSIRSMVTLVNSGNVDLSKLPVPPGVKPFHPSVQEMSYTTTAKPAEMAAACRKLLIAAGWEPYGRLPISKNLPDSSTEHFKKNGIRLKAWVMTTPVDGGKTLIRYSTDLLSADLPAPPDVEDPRFDEAQKVLRFSVTPAEADGVYAFYRDRLSKLGWKATTEQPVQDDRKSFQVYRNPQQDYLSLDLTKYTESVEVKLTHLTAAELAAQEKLAEAAALRARQQMEERNRPVKVAVDLPAVATKLKHEERKLLEFAVPTGSGAEHLRTLRTQLIQAGWKELDGTQLDDKTSGRMSFEQGHAKLRLSYFDIGFGTASIEISGTDNVVLEPKAAKGASAAKGGEVAPDKKTKPAIPGLPELPPGVDLPPEAADFLKKALEQPPRPPQKRK